MKYVSVLSTVPGSKVPPLYLSIYFAVGGGIIHWNQLHTCEHNTQFFI